MTQPSQSEPRFKVQQHADGQVYISDDGRQMHHVLIRDEHDVSVQVGIGDQVEIDKMYGPTVFMPIRVWIDMNACEWVVEREFGPEGEWREVARIPGQIDEDFTS